MEIQVPWRAATMLNPSSVLPVILLCALFISLVTVEWSFVAVRPFWFNALGRTMPLALVAILLLSTKGLNLFLQDRLVSVSVSLAFGSLVVSLLLAPIVYSGQTATLRFDHYLNFLLALVCFILGYIVSFSRAISYKLLLWLAVMLTGVSALGAFGSDYIPQQWSIASSVGFVCLFSWSFFSVRFFSANEHRIFTLFGFGVNFFYVMVPFRKPVFLSALVCFFYAFLICTVTARKKLVVLARLFSIMAILVLVFGAMQIATSGRVFSDYVSVYETQFVHANETSDMEGLVGGIDRISGRRIGLWKSSQETAGGFLVIGRGLGQVAPLYSGELVMVHNSYLDWYLSFGLLGTLPMLFLVGLWFRFASGLSASSDSVWAVAPAASYAAGLLFLGMGTNTRLFFTLTAVGALVGGIALGHIRQRSGGQRRTIGPA